MIGPVDVRTVVVYRDAAGRWNGAFPQIARLPDGRLVVAFREAAFPPSSGSGSHDHGDKVSRGVIVWSTDDGATWDPASHRVLDDHPLGLEQMSISATRDGLLLSPSARRRPNTNRENETWVRRSADGGETWDEATLMQPGVLAWVNVHAPMLELPDGTLLSPHCGSIGTHSTKQHPQAVLRSTDRGRTWGDGAVIALDPSGARVYHQGSLGRFSDGEIVAVMHSDERRKSADGQDVMLVGLWLSRSTDDGRTWSALEQLPLEFSGATHHALVLNDDRLLCVWGNRYDPSIRASVSADRGRTWETNRGWPLREGVHLDTSGTRTRLRGQTTDGVIHSRLFTDIGEPCSAQLPDGRIITVYYWLNGADDPMRYIEAAIYELA